jgi:hypothetical protein
MMHRWAARFFVLALCALVPGQLFAQGQQSSKDPRTGSSLEQNYPNPFNPETRIPFRIGGYPNCVSQGRQYRVSLRIFNVLAQQVAIPILQGGAPGVAGGQLLESLLLPCGEYTGYWDGKLRNGREAASGIYGIRLEIEGSSPLMRKMTIRK